MAKKKVEVSKNVFKAAVEATPDIKSCYQTGLDALGGYRNRVKATDTRQIQGSVDIDGCTVKKYPSANRWDYAIGYNSEAYFVEVHSAISSEVSTMIKKLQWLKDWLKTHATELDKIKAKNRPYIWIQSGRFDIPKHMPQYRAAVNNGIFPVKELTL